MSYYINNMIICNNEFFYKYFFDNAAFWKKENQIIISFNKLFNVKSVEEYCDKIGTPISYAWNYSYVSHSENMCVTKFQTRSFYPIEAIIRAIELSHDLEWYAVAEDEIYVSKFYWSDEVKEDVLLLDDGYGDWRLSQLDYDDAVFEDNDSDTGVWYYLQYNKNEWMNCKRLNNPSVFHDREAYTKFPV